MKVYLKSDEEVELLREANLLIGKTLAELAKNIKPGVTTKQLDVLAETFIRDHGAIPTFKGFPNQFGPEFPASICTSVNEQVVHGIPNDKPLVDGDIVSIDCGTKLNGFCGDSCYTFAVGEISDDVRLLLQTTKEALYKGIEQAVAGRRIGDISYAVQTHCENMGFGVVREFVGHGVGHEMHEDPQVPNFGRRGNGMQLKDGLCIAIEPMITMGTREIYLQEDQWGIVTRDKKPAAHFEHSVCVRKGKADILSSFEEIETVLNNL